jgi:hypothetical protein
MSLRESPVKEPPLQIPLTGPLCEETGVSFPEPTFTYLTEYPVKKPSLQVPRRTSIERDAPFPEPSFAYLSRVPRKRTPYPPGSPNRAPYEDMIISRAFFDVITIL